jgi:hypothetical protein
MDILSQAYPQRTLRKYLAGGEKTPKGAQMGIRSMNSASTSDP